MTEISSNAKKHLTKNPIKNYLLKKFNETFIDFVKKTSARNILDVGCGEGFMICNIKDQLPSCNITGIDISIDALTIAKRKCPDADFYIGNASELKFDNDSFDLVICSEVLEHIKKPETALSELYRVSSKNIILSVPNEPWFWLSNLISLNHISGFGNAPGHVNHWNPASFNKLVSSHIDILDFKLSFPWILTLGICKGKDSNNS